MNKTTHILISAALLITMGGTAAAQKVAYNVTGMESTGFNAMDYRLQKPLANDTFPSGEGGFGKHMFVGLGTGMSTIIDEHRPGQPKFNVSAHWGGWFTPLHGMRINVGYGSLSVHKNVAHAWAYTASAEYMLNLSNLATGYDNRRKLEVIGSIGAEYNRVHQSGFNAGNDYGLTTALQFRYNAGPSLYLFAEPRLSVIGGTRYDTDYDWRRYKSNLSLTIGLGYRLLDKKARMAGAESFNKKEENMFYGINGGLMGLTHIGQFKSGYGEVYVGHMMTSVSGWQIGAGYGDLRAGGKLDKGAKFTIASADYVLNISSLIEGYRPGNVFSLEANAGISAMNIDREDRNTLFVPGLNAGLTGVFRLSPSWSLTLHPQLFMFTDKFTDCLDTRQSPLVYFTAGIRYTLNDFAERFPESFAEYAKAKNWFITAGTGINIRFKGHYGTGFNGSLGIGRRFTPTSSWRLTLDGDIYSKSPVGVATTLHADYMTSLTTAIMGYDPKRPVDVQLLMGAFGGIANYYWGIRHTYGLSTGVQVGVRLNDNFDLYVEPQFQALYAPDMSDRTVWNPEMRFNVGLRYKLGGTPDFESTASNDNPNFISVMGGPNLFSDGAFGNRRSFEGMVDIQLGRWFSRVFGARVTYGNEWLHQFGYTARLSSVHGDLMLDITQLLDRDNDRRFHISPVIGAGVGFSGAPGSQTNVMTYGGVQFRYNILRNLDLQFEPGLTFWANRIIPDPSNTVRFVMFGRTAFGAALRF